MKSKKIKVNKYSISHVLSSKQRKNFSHILSHTFYLQRKKEKKEKKEPRYEPPDNKKPLTDHLGEHPPKENLANLNAANAHHWPEGATRESPRTTLSTSQTGHSCFINTAGQVSKNQRLPFNLLGIFLVLVLLQQI